MSDPVTGRRYSGLPAAERAAARRAALVAAGLQLFGTAGYASTSVKEICTEAGLTQRYFYESFKDRQALLIEVYGDCVAGMRESTVAGIEAFSGSALDDDIVVSALTAFVGYLTADPRRARIVLLEVMGVGPVLEEIRHGVIRSFADLVVAEWSNDDPVDADRLRTRRLTAIALVGAVNHLLVDWLLSGENETADQLVAVCVTLFQAARRESSTFVT